MGRQDNSEGEVLKMHDLLRQMGQGIVFDENKDPVNRSRLWNVKDVCRVLERKEDVKMSPTAFSKMDNLRFLKITHFYAGRNDIDYIEEEVRKRLHCPNGLESFASYERRYFHWDFYPLKYLPDDLSTENLVVLIMRGSQLELLWNADQPLELEKLKEIDLSFSKHLIQIPNLSLAINLQDIHLQDCTSLVHIPPFFHNLNKLRSLDMTNCKNLEYGIENLPNSLRDLTMDGTAIKRLPESIWELKYLKRLRLLRCTNLRKISEISNNMECLVEIILGKTKIEGLPKSFENLTALQGLGLVRCHKIKFLPNSLCKLLRLEKLILAKCSSLEELPPLPHGLDYLNITSCKRLKSIAELPLSLRHLKAEDCRSLETISSRWSPPNHDYNYLFTNCLKLDEDTRNNVIVKLTCLLSSPRPDDVRYFSHILYPGCEIPEWFSYRTDGGNSVDIHLPENWFELPLRFAFCIVFYGLCSKNGSLGLNLEYGFNFKTNTINSDDCLYSYYCNWFTFRIDRAIDRDHVYIFPTIELKPRLSEVFGPNWSSIYSNITEASFRLSFHGQKDQNILKAWVEAFRKRVSMKNRINDCGSDEEDCHSYWETLEEL
ncbi:disease resistance-like protein CSA1 [Ziziphus jujuba]|uniref:Disease resistance-like protein CSA1 n=1 Tax=Ziziphus jujuba TaxID=326968 RepID=A0ABM4AAW5_ZIZJJ|nr:disease resistance-like protein CSA1 [Ziziphus jujuba]